LKTQDDRLDQDKALNEDENLLIVSCDFMYPEHVVTQGYADLRIPFDRPIVHL